MGLVQFVERLLGLLHDVVLQVVLGLRVRKHDLEVQLVLLPLAAFVNDGFFGRVGIA
jgi:hypothetical protein